MNAQMSAQMSAPMNAQAPPPTGNLQNPLWRREPPKNQDFPHWPYQYMQTLPGAQSDTGKVAGESSNRWYEMAALNSVPSHPAWQAGMQCATTLNLHNMGQAPAPQAMSPQTNAQMSAQRNAQMNAQMNAQATTLNRHDMGQAIATQSKVGAGMTTSRWWSIKWFKSSSLQSLPNLMTTEPEEKLAVVPIFDLTRFNLDVSLDGLFTKLKAHGAHRNCKLLHGVITHLS
eukprot:s4029_g5.t3